MKEDQNYSFGDWIGHRRRSLDLTQPELAARLHCSVDTIKKIESDSRRPSKQLAELMAVQFGIPEGQRSLFIECARGLRAVDALQRFESAQATLLIPPSKKLQAQYPPVDALSIIGRETELEQLNRLMTDARLITITGPGGIGKSTLARAVMADAQRHGTRAAFISLVGLDSIDHILIQAASSLGLVAESDPKQQILDYLQTRKFLLVFDNFEHLLKGASLITDILRSTTTVTVLVTSRERLRLHEEQVFPLQGLRYPERFIAADPNLYPASQLFLSAARRLIPDFEPVDANAIFTICQITEGMPLALEMAASWVDTLSFAEIVDELSRNLNLLTQEYRDVPARHRSMRAVFDSSWQHLDKTERDVFSRLCIFRGGFSRASSEAVAGATTPVLATLVRRSMIRLDPVHRRYSIHELLRLYGEEHLKMSQMFHETQIKHLLYFVQMAATAQTVLHTREQVMWFENLDAEQDNIRAALAWALEEPEQKETASQLVLTLCWYWRIRSQVVEGRRWVERALDAQPSSVELKAGLHFHAGHFGWMQGEVDFAFAQEQLSLQLWQSLGKAGINGSAYVHHTLGMVADLVEDLSGSQEHFQTSRDLFKESGDNWGLSFARLHLGAQALSAGDLDTARRLLQESEYYFRTCGDEWALGLLLGFYGRIEFQRGELEAAEKVTREALAIRKRTRHIHSIMDSMDLLVQIAIEKNDLDAARQLLESAIEIASELGNQGSLMRFKERLASL